MKAIRIETCGAPDVLRLREVPVPPLEARQVRVRVEAAGLNFIDIYQRTGLYPVPLPYTPGLEGSGVVEAVGPAATGWSIGDRAAWADTLGSYAEVTVVPAERLVKVPAGLDLQTAAAVMLQGMTAHYLVESVFPLRSADTCLIHAAAGGVGLLLVQMAKHKGARVFGTVSTEEKAKLAIEAGADAVIRYEREDFRAEVMRLTGGRGANVVFDSVGKATFDRSLDCLGPRGMMVLFGQSSGPVPPLSPSVLAGKSLFLTRPSLFHYTSGRAELEARAEAVLGAVATGRLKVRIDRTFPLAEAAQAHRALESRQTSGKVLLIP